MAGHEPIEFVKTPVQSKNGLDTPIRGWFLRGLNWISRGSRQSQNPGRKLRRTLIGLFRAARPELKSPPSAERGRRDRRGDLMDTTLPINPRFRAYGKARIDIASRVHSAEDWEALWKDPIHPFPFTWKPGWKQGMEYKVDDFAAEVGFFTDVLGFTVSSLGSDYAMFSTPDEAFTFSVVNTSPDGQSTAPNSVNIRFTVENILETATELERRGVVFEQFPAPFREGAELYAGYFRTPHGICIDLWGELDLPSEGEPEIEMDGGDSDVQFNIDWGGNVPDNEMEGMGKEPEPEEVWEEADNGDEDPDPREDYLYTELEYESGDDVSAYDIDGEALDDMEGEDDRTQDLPPHTKQSGFRFGLRTKH